MGADVLFNHNKISRRKYCKPRLHAKLPKRQNKFFMRVLDETMATNDRLMPVNMDANVAELSDDVQIRFTKYSPPISMGKIRSFVNSARDGRTRLRKEMDYFINDSPWAEEIADKVAFDPTIQSVCLNILDFNDVEFRFEEMADLRKIEDAPRCSRPFA